jgi:hypothetical protein
LTKSFITIARLPHSGWCLCGDIKRGKGEEEEKKRRGRRKKRGKRRKTSRTEDGPGPDFSTGLN